ncbi:MAG: TonB-dependent receptor [Rhodothermales bacterium]|nr:TonB-dependent receptor [Rhodothermales bacterium]
MKVIHLVSLFTVLTILCLGTTEASAQQARLRGFVTDSTNGKPLQGVNVVLHNNGQQVTGTVTDGDGSFLFSNAPTGVFELLVSFIGFETKSQIVTIERGSFQTLRLSLGPSSTEFGELVVEAERSSGAIVTAGLQTIVGADIDRIPIPGVSGDLVSVLQSTPGVVSAGDRGGQLFIRGGEPTQNLVLIDGIQLYQPFHILGFYSAFPSDIVNTASVYAGGFGAEHGGRISSVIDIQSRNGNKNRYAGSLSVSPFLSTLHLEGPVVKDYVSVVASIRESLVSLLVPDLYGQKLPYEFGDRFVKLHAQPSSSLSFSGTYIHSYDRGDIAGTRLTIRGDIDNNAPVDTSLISWDNFGVGGTVSFLPRGLPIRGDLTVSHSIFETEIGPRGDPERLAKISGLSINQQFSTFSRYGKLTAGLFYNETDLSYRLNGAFQEIADEDSSTVTETGGFGTLEIRLPREASVTLGARFQAYPNQDKLTFEPRARLAFPFGIRDTRHNVSIAAGLYHQGIVGLSDERDAGNIFTVWTGLSESAEIPRATHIIAGWQGSAQPVARTYVRASLEGYYKNLDNLSVPVWDAFPQFTTALQSATGSVKGLDARIEVTYEQLYAYLGLGRARTEYQALEGEVFGTFYGVSQDIYSPPHDRRNQVNAVVRADVGELTLTAQWQYGSGLPYTQAVGFDDWLLLQGDIDLLSDPGQTRVLYEEPYASRLPDYHRLDLWLEKEFETTRFSGMLRAGVVNAYNRANLFYFDLFTLNRIEQLPAIPSLGARLEF